MLDTLPENLIFLTGVTGAVGTELLPRLLQRYPHATIVTLIRGKDQADVEARLTSSMAFAEAGTAQRKRIVALKGDVSQPSLGLDEPVLALLARKTGQIFHLAANVRFNAGLEESRQANVESTRAILRFARSCHLSHPGGVRLNYISTAYVVGNRRGPLLERELNCGHTFWNSYEQSKMEAEELVRAAEPELPITIYRPSQIIGTAEAGKVRKLFGFLEFLKLTCTGKIRLLPASPETRTDMIPVDYVCDAIAYLSGEKDTVGHTYHLAAGLQRSTSLGEVVEIAYRILQEYAPSEQLPKRPEFIPVDVFEQHAVDGKVHKSFSGLLQLYQTYMSYERDFEVDATMARLARGGIVLAPMRDVVHASALYVVRQHFGITDPVPA